jgi:hypothetical protein
MGVQFEVFRVRVVVSRKLLKIVCRCVMVRVGQLIGC